MTTPHDKHTTGLYGKFIISRVDGTDAPGGKHDGCDYFALDLTHDPFAMPAIKAYADACRTEYPVLAADLDAKLTLSVSPPEHAETTNEDKALTRSDQPQLRAGESDQRGEEGADPSHCDREFCRTTLDLWRAQDQFLQDIIEALGVEQPDQIIPEIRRLSAVAPAGEEKETP